MNKKRLQQKKVRLKEIHAHLQTEWYQLDALLQSVGFPKGISSAREVALELIKKRIKKREC